MKEKHSFEGFVNKYTTWCHVKVLELLTYRRENKRMKSSCMKMREKREKRREGTKVKFD